jgi:excisionase family DNA binding protein
MTNNEIPVYSLADLSKRLKISVRTLREYIKQGELKAKKIGRTYYVTKTNLMSFFRPRKEKIEPIVTADELDNFQDELEFDEDSGIGIPDELLRKRRNIPQKFSKS